MNKDQLKQFVIDFEKKIGDYFEELEQEINEVDLSDKTKEHLIAIMNKDCNRTFGFVEEKCRLALESQE
jgi:hypothetical protein